METETSKIDTEVEKLIDKYIQQLYPTQKHIYDKLRNNIWTVNERDLHFNIILTSKLIVFDTLLFDELPQNCFEFYEALLIMNAHRTKSSKICLVDKTVHLRVIRGLEGLDFNEFEDHIVELRRSFPDIQESLYLDFYRQ